MQHTMASQKINYHAIAACLNLSLLVFSVYAMGEISSWIGSNEPVLSC